MVMNFLKAREYNCVNKKYYKSLNYSIVDGMFWALMFGLGETYIIPFAILNKASILLISLIPGLGQLCISVSSIAGSQFIQNYQQRKKTTVNSVKIQAISWILLFILTYLTKTPAFIIVIYLIGVLAGNFCGSAWSSWMNSLVPLSIRGKFWGTRNFYIGVSQMIATIGAGIILSVAKKDFHNSMLGFFIIFTLAFIFRYSCTYPLSRQFEPKMQIAKREENIPFLKFVLTLVHSNFGRFVLFNLLFTFAVCLVTPMLPVFYLRSLGFSYFQFAIINISFILSTFIMMKYWGPLTDKYGNYTVFSFSAYGATFIILGMVVFRSFIPFVILNLISGFFWSGYGLSAQNFIFDSSNQRNTHINIAYFTALINIAAFVGSLSGGILAHSIQKAFFLKQLLPSIKWTNQKLEFVFALSLIVRIIIIILFIRTFKGIRRKKMTHHPMLIFVFYPVLEYINKLIYIVPKIPEKIIKKDKTC